MSKYDEYFGRAVASLYGEGRYRIFANLERCGGAFPRAWLHEDDAKREIVI